MHGILASDASTDVDTKVLVLYTGGTIGMLVGANQSFTPEPHFLVESLRAQTRFHDPLGDSLFSHASTAEGFRAWSHNSSGRSSPTESSSPPGATAIPPATGSHVPTLLVRSSRPIAPPPDRSAPPGQTLFRQHTSKKVSSDCYEMHIPSLVTPRALDAQGNWKRIRYAILEWEPLLDSSNMDMTGTVDVIATEIELNYHLFDAFVVLHGTDTMCYSSSALSFLLEDLGKTVILTGAQIPLAQLRNDAVDNFLGALWLAGYYIIPEVSLYFNHVLYRGNRCSKTSSFALNAFESPNFPALVNVGIDVVVNWSNVLRQTNLRKFHVHKAAAHFVSATLRLFPGITGDIVRAFLMPPIRGVVLETFGAGNAPQRQDLMTALRDACDRGVVIVAISQCTKGSVSDAYETGQTLLQSGVVPGGDMTPECALAKLAYLLSKSELSVQDVRSLVGKPLRGELTAASGDRPPTLTTAERVQDMLAQVVRISTNSFPNSGSRGHLPPITITVDQSGEHKPLDVTATWGSTASETVTTEAALAPFLIHLAAARDDVDAVTFCLEAEAAAERSETGRHAIAGGMVNCVDFASGRTPLHAAALNGSILCVNALLEAGALVHMRDSMDHSPLYYAARQGHEAVVDTLVKAGAHLGGSDIKGSFVALAVTKARRKGDVASLRVWRKAGAEIPQDEIN
ncbi:asparaginase-domain-containing protein [Exidia glandulosa HHB12029]|uniref:asparaginase n=1 Tax=Exidia glandulosa HHB12029 TaxID=1314781 RepID=A0A165BVN5_EXIGL|nr:asparaginase-domain-containing protein [Exidia glandulosa HHB12029]